MSLSCLVIVGLLFWELPHFLTQDFLGPIRFSLPNPRTNYFLKEPYELRSFFLSARNIFICFCLFNLFIYILRSFDINLLSSFHYLMLHLKLFLTWTVYKLSQRYTVKVVEFVFVEFVLVIQHCLAVSPSTPLSILFVPLGWSRHEVAGRWEETEVNLSVD